MNISNIIDILTNKTVLAIKVIKIFVKHYIISNLAKLFLKKQF